MKKIATILITLGVVLSVPLAAKADPKSDLKAFQGYFLKKFPGVKLSSFHDGVYALPQDKAARAQWEQIMVFPPYELELAKGKKFWEANGLASCFRNGGKGVAAHYPYWDKRAKEVRTIVNDINSCLVKKGKKAIKDLKKGTMAEVVAYMKSLSNGYKMKIDVSDPGMQAMYEYGKKFFWAKRGQLNFACADCHLHAAGNFIGGEVLGPALGHGTGFPVYRSKWGNLGTLHRRYGGCNKQVRAKPFAAQSKEYKALEVYEMYMDTGIPIKAPSQRG
ncbi:MAG: sulfur oxidation c-type cytochrome SoxA [Acidiferrobacteraceae bacterium]|jgi:sulfur-oxidizing protein SoxA